MVKRDFILNNNKQHVEHYCIVATQQQRFRNIFRKRNQNFWSIKFNYATIRGALS